MVTGGDVYKNWLDFGYSKAYFSLQIMYIEKYSWNLMQWAHCVHSSEARTTNDKAW